MQDEIDGTCSIHAGNKTAYRILVSKLKLTA
jgi:hypothetical protein